MISQRCQLAFDSEPFQAFNVYPIVTSPLYIHVYMFVPPAVCCGLPKIIEEKVVGSSNMLDLT